MTPQKMDDILNRYEIWAENSEMEEAAKIADMIPKIRGFLEQNRTEKAMRWLGFMQGVLWHAEVYTLDELKTHNRSDVETVAKLRDLLRKVERNWYLGTLNGPDPRYAILNEMKLEIGMLTDV